MAPTERDALRDEIRELTSALRTHTAGGGGTRWVDRILTVGSAILAAFLTMKLDQARMMERIDVNQHNVEKVERQVEKNREQLEAHVFQWHRGTSAGR